MLDHVLNLNQLFNDNKENPKLNIFDYLFLFYYILKVWRRQMNISKQDLNRR